MGFNIDGSLAVYLNQALAFQKKIILNLLLIINIRKLKRIIFLA